MYFRVNPLITPWKDSAALYAGAMVLGYGMLVGGLVYLFLKGPKMTNYQAQVCLGLTPLALVLGSPVCHQFYYILALPLFWTLIAGPGRMDSGWGVRVAAFVLYLIFSVPTPGLIR